MLECPLLLPMGTSPLLTFAIPVDTDKIEAHLTIDSLHGSVPVNNYNDNKLLQIKNESYVIF